MAMKPLNPKSKSSNTPYPMPKLIKSPAAGGGGMTSESSDAFYPMPKIITDAPGGGGMTSERKPVNERNKTIRPIARIMPIANKNTRGINMKGNLVGAVEKAVTSAPSSIGVSPVEKAVTSAPSSIGVSSPESGIKKKKK